MHMSLSLSLYIYIYIRMIFVNMLLSISISLSLYICICIYCTYITFLSSCQQLLDGSISISPLYAALTNDLHVSIATSLHQTLP